MHAQPSPRPPLQSQMRPWMLWVVLLLHPPASGLRSLSSPVALLTAWPAVEEVCRPTLAASRLNGFASSSAPQRLDQAALHAESRVKGAARCSPAGLTALRACGTPADPASWKTCPADGRLLRLARRRGQLRRARRTVPQLHHPSAPLLHEERCLAAQCFRVRGFVPPSAHLQHVVLANQVRLWPCMPGPCLSLGAFTSWCSKEVANVCCCGVAPQIDVLACG